MPVSLASSYLCFDFGKPAFQQVQAKVEHSSASNGLPLPRNSHTSFPDYIHNSCTSAQLLMNILASEQNMSKQPKNESIPLLCSLCPKNPKFSDISHLLTHISSKGHLSHRFKLQIRCQADTEARGQLEAFDAWYADNSLDELLADRLASKEQKNGLKRTLQKAVRIDHHIFSESLHPFANYSIQPAKEKTRKGKDKAENRTEDVKLGANIDDRLLSTPIYKAPVPRMHMWSTVLPHSGTPFDSVPSSRWEEQDAYATPTMRRSIPNFTHHDSPEADNRTNMYASYLSQRSRPQTNKLKLNIAHKIK
jgi:hypothetical protein